MDNQKNTSSGKTRKGLVLLLIIFIVASIFIAAIDSSQASPQFQTFYLYFSQLVSGPIMILLWPLGITLGKAGIKAIGIICVVLIVMLTLLVASRKCQIPFMGIYITIWFATGYVLYFIAQIIVG
jgi:hypothetical protein